jgi:hypothetical protein
MSRRTLLSILLLSALLGASSVAAQETSTRKEQVWRGTWAASAGPRTFHGRWWAELLENTKNAASGSWTLLSDSNQILLQGTWSARKSARGWEGTWTARVKSGRPFSGTWSSDLKEGSTFEDMFTQAIAKQVTGSWASGRMQGNWWLMGPGY